MWEPPRRQAKRFELVLSALSQEVSTRKWSCKNRKTRASGDHDKIGSVLVDLILHNRRLHIWKPNKSFLLCDHSSKDVVQFFNLRRKTITRGFCQSSFEGLHELPRRHLQKFELALLAMSRNDPSMGFVRRRSGKIDKTRAEPDQEETGSDTLADRVLRNKRVYIGKRNILCHLCDQCQNDLVHCFNLR
uniref:Uncharacterized protein n=1 Tax=Compsopogon caeruleus TaxID=31354 RepID=A0A7S1TEB2_9RHOD|mmetsp:Transcript_3238/g.6093  ORF Transcript_3238/g.6093 Transcript_3238/m.6093 type:complete len:189 (+) Transcript_3238:2224-2790(+)